MKSPQTVLVRNPENITILTPELMKEFNKEIKAGIHGSLIKYVHGMANKYNINPVNFHPTFRQYEFQIHASKPHLIRLNNCYIHSDMILFDSKKNIIQENLNSYYEWDDGFFPNRIWKPAKVFHAALKLLRSCKIISQELDFIIRKKVAFKKYSKQLFSKPNKIIEVENALIFSDQYFYVFGHFIHENFPRLYFLFSQLTKEEKANYKLILPPKNNGELEEFYFQYITPCLEALGITQGQVIYLEKDSLLKAKNLILASQIKFHPVVKEAINFLRDFYSDDSTEFKNYEKVYFTRKNAKRRRVLNEEEVQESLIKQGFKVVCIEELSFKQQMNLLKNVKVFLALDSSTLTNVIFCKNCEHCLIFTCDKITCPLFGTVADKTKFYYQFCEPEDRKNFNWWSSNIYIDVKELQNNLQKIAI